MLNQRARILHRHGGHLNTRAYRETQPVYRENRPREPIAQACRDGNCENSRGSGGRRASLKALFAEISAR